jgi:type I restriction enzyme, R subunit
MKPEEKARQNIDKLLQAAGWCVQDLAQLNLNAALGVAVREFPTQAGPADYLLFVDRRPLGVIEAKAEGATLSGVADLSGKYLAGATHLPHVAGPLPFAYESTGVETFFRDGRDPQPRSRRVFAFHRPETLLEWARQPDTLRARLQNLPSLPAAGLRQCQIEAIRGLEASLQADRPRALVQMATGSGKTFMAVSHIYRLIRYGGARRVVFLVDRSNLGRQTLKEFQQYVTPDDGRKFTELYNVQHLASNLIDPVCKVVITTIQRLYSMLRGEAEYDPEIEERSLYEIDPAGEKPREVAYNPLIPIETFDFLFSDESHRSIYNLWRQVLEYFDAYLAGLTATPSKQTLGFFNQNLVTEYSHERAVADGVNVGYEVYRIRSQITEQGSAVEAGYYVDKRDKLTRKVRWQKLDEDLVYTAAQLDRDVVAVDQIRTVIRALRHAMFTELFPGRFEMPKTLIFAKDDSHAEDIVEIVRQEFGKGNEFCKKITYKTTGEKAEDLIASFRNSYHPRIAVTVDMISTGTDIKPLECLVFMRDVKSAVYFEQMKGRGTRTIHPTELQAVTPGVQAKTHFVIVDAVGVTQNDKTDSRPLERKRSLSFEKLLFNLAIGQRDEDLLTSLAGRLARLEQTASPQECAQIKNAAGGKSLAALANLLLDAVDPEAQIARARAIFAVETPDAGQVAAAAQELAQAACVPFDNPALRDLLVEIHTRREQTIDALSQDALLSAGFDAAAQDGAQRVVGAFRQFIEDHKDELTALQILYSQPYAARRLTYQAVKDLAEAIRRPPYGLTAEAVWQAYERLEQSRVRRAGPQRLLTDLVALIRFALQRSETLEPFPVTVAARFQAWLAEQAVAGRQFDAEQLKWLSAIQSHVAASLQIEPEDFDYTPFYEMGGAARAYRLFGAELAGIMDELNEVLVK